jgi:CheY-like chemotaxis protein
LAQELLATRPDVPILVTSGYLRPEDQQKAERIGVRGLTLKPDTIEELCRNLDRLLQDGNSPK